ncbi:MAG TPA: PaaI family thioesterase [Candidatus Cybelea sp.]|jgi:uncharacterized protein (TIGR00369 family)|nr:PaaI family thioesterase [Candidatus Cybelea sp.]
MANVEEIFRNASFVESLGIELVGYGTGWCETRVVMRPGLQQQHGFAHAGVIMTLADHTLGGAAATMVPADKDIITVDNKTTFLRPGTGTVLRCRAEVLRAGKTLAFVEAIVRSDSEGKETIVATASSTVAVIDLASGRAARS